MVRAPYFDKNGTKKGAWSKYEDDKLRAYIEKHGHPNWRKLPKLAGLSRCRKSCRLRWKNYLCPNVKRGNYTNEEEDLIINLHKNHGNKWSLIAGKLSGRSDNEIKNHWHTYLKKRVKQSSIVSYSSSETFQNIECDKEKDITRFFDLNGKDEAEFLQAFLSSESTSSANNKQSTFSTSSGLDLVATNGSSSQSWNDEKSGCFWTNPFLLDTCSSVSNEYLITPIDLVNMYVSSTPDQDMIMVDDILW